MDRNRVRLVPLTIATALLSATLLSLSVTGTLSGFTASVVNSANTVTSGSLTMEEKNSAGTTTCTSSAGSISSANEATCSSINKFGGALLYPGHDVVNAVTIRNTGTTPAGTFTLTPGASCTQGTSGSPSGSATDFCSKVNLRITTGSTTVFNDTLANFAGSAAKPLTALGAGEIATYTFTVSLTTSDNAYQALTAAVPMTWKFTG